MAVVGGACEVVSGCGLVGGGCCSGGGGGGGVETSSTAAAASLTWAVSGVRRQPCVQERTSTAQYLFSSRGHGSTRESITKLWSTATPSLLRKEQR